MIPTGFGPCPQTPPQLVQSINWCSQCPPEQNKGFSFLLAVLSQPTAWEIFCMMVQSKQTADRGDILAQRHTIEYILMWKVEKVGLCFQNGDTIILSLPKDSVVLLP
jgi:hypothetical protein